MVYGMALGAAPVDGAGGNEGEGFGTVCRAIPLGKSPFYTADEISLEVAAHVKPIGFKPLGFKDRTELAFEDNVKRSVFIYPDRLKYLRGKHTFAALLKKMIEKKKIGLVLALTRHHAAPVFCAMLPQIESGEEGGWNEPAGFHLIPLPFADDVRGAPLDQAFRGWSITPLQASAFREEFDSEAFKDLTRPKYNMIHKCGGNLMEEWKRALLTGESVNVVPVTTGSKRKAAEIRSKHEVGALAKVGTLNGDPMLPEVLPAAVLSSTICAGTKKVLTPSA
ncbi:SPOC like C-terminal domain-containing protein [Suillus plorans]|uniref:DNA helicase n=1 Tax=Suillus plorans TaxID=116603 RepID=A0A9P7AJI4_9AGAM|nr:SPOC like C-terminal domain-containing protein [Suillus plorans]KAG1789705.1 SPOC like C-terminal domain-containing protein [Suillus plorans]